MTDAREWLTEPGVMTSDEAYIMCDALLAVLDECDRVEARTMLRGDIRSDDLRRIINKALGVNND